MRILFFILLLFTFVPASFAAENNIYICPMHYHITGEEGDTCPICGMALVPRVQDEQDVRSHQDHETGMTEGNVYISNAYMQALGVKSVEVTYHEFGRNIKAYGEVVPSSRREYQINLQSEGWIKTLNTTAVGDVVKKGDILFTLYSQDIMSAQSDFLVGGRGNSEQRLKLVGMDDQAIALLKQKRHMMEETPFHALADGIVTELMVRKGSFVPKAGLAMIIQDFSSVWAVIDVPLRDSVFLKIGTPVTVTVPETGQTYESKIDYIHPINDSQSRTVRVRAVLDNSDRALKVQTYVDGVFHAEKQYRLSIPSEAVLYGKMGTYVIEDTGNGYFTPVMVEAGITSDGYTEIIKGLSHGQKVVQSGQFMLDAESNLKGGMATMGHNHGDDSMNLGQNSQKESQAHVH